MYKEVITMKITNEEVFDKENVFGKGQANSGFAQYFMGESYLNPLTRPGASPVFLANVTFEPGCRNNWHIHHATKGGGQILICTAGSGWYQEEGKAAVSLEPGTVITIPPEVKHWHGAKADSWFSHIALEVPGENTKTEWFEPVSDEEYGKLK
jgi:quercetin dioxygenase-like cupin family protein